MSKKVVLRRPRNHKAMARPESGSEHIRGRDLLSARKRKHSLAGSIHKGRVTRVLPGHAIGIRRLSGWTATRFCTFPISSRITKRYDKIVTSVGGEGSQAGPRSPRALAEVAETVSGWATAAFPGRPRSSRQRRRRTDAVEPLCPNGTARVTRGPALRSGPSSRLPRWLHDLVVTSSLSSKKSETYRNASRSSPISTNADCMPGKTRVTLPLWNAAGQRIFVFALIVDLYHGVVFHDRHACSCRLARNHQFFRH